MMSPESLQVLLVDGLFLGLAGALALWFRSWIKSQQSAIDRRLAALEAQYERFDRLGSRLQSACRSIEYLSRRTSEADSSGLTAGPADRERPATSLGDSQSVRSNTAVTVRRPGAAPPLISGKVGVSGTGFARARDLFEQGFPTKEVAERLGMGLGEVDALKRMMDIQPARGEGGTT